MFGEKGHFAWTKAVAGDEVQIEVLQFIGPDFLGGLLRGPTQVAVGARHQFRRDFRFEYGLQRRIGGLIKLSRRDNPTDEILDEGLGH